MGAVDIIIVVILIASTVFGGFRGVVREAVSLAAWFFGIWLALRFYGSVGQWLDGLHLHRALSNPVVANIAAFLLVLIATFIVVTTVGRMVRSMVNLTGMTPVDRVLGLAFGFARGVLIVIVLVTLAEMTPIARTDGWRNSRLVRPFKVATLLIAERIPTSVDF